MFTAKLSPSRTLLRLSPRLYRSNILRWRPIIPKIPEFHDPSIRSLGNKNKLLKLLHDFVCVCEDWIRQGKPIPDFDLKICFNFNWSLLRLVTLQLCEATSAVVSSHVSFSHREIVPMDLSSNVTLSSPWSDGKLRKPPSCQKCKKEGSIGGQLEGLMSVQPCGKYADTHANTHLIE